MTEETAPMWFTPILPPPWLPWAVGVLAVFVAALAVWVSCGW